MSNLLSRLKNYVNKKWRKSHLQSSFRGLYKRLDASSNYKTGNSYELVDLIFKIVITGKNLKKLKCACRESNPGHDLSQMEWEGRILPLNHKRLEKYFTTNRIFGIYKSL